MTKNVKVNSCSAQITTQPLIHVLIFLLSKLAKLTVLKNRVETKRKRVNGSHSQHIMKSNKYPQGIYIINYFMNSMDMIWFGNRRHRLINFNKKKTLFGSFDHWL